MKTYIAILGFGTVGFGVYDIIQKSEYLKDVVVKKVLDKNELPEYKGLVTKNFQEILDDKQITVVIEAMGAQSYSYECIKKALMSKKSVITANKEVIANHIKELTEIKAKEKVSLYYEASVGGGIPIIKQLYTISLINEITEITGILNGTTNFILTKMQKEGMNYSLALRKAQELGFAESDPTNDVEGLDMVRKIVILSSIAYKTAISIKRVYHYGIKNISNVDIDYANSNKYTVKYIASSKLINNNILLTVEPVFVSQEKIASIVDNEFNYISVNASINGELLFFGKGAGRYPTANAMINDLIMILNGDKNYTFTENRKVSIIDAKVKSKYYLRVKNIQKVKKSIIDKIDNNLIITKEITLNEINKLIKMDAIYFYARIK